MYNHEQIEKKWQEKWRTERIYEVDLEKASKPFYNLMMFPYPSAEGLHVGNMYAFTGADVYGRFKRMQGYDVFEPIGLDGFGIHSENYALKIGEHPAKVAERTEKNFYCQLHAIGNGYAWDSTLETYDPEYYRWTQWIFVQLFNHGLAYRAKSSVNWCPSCKTVLSDEQVVREKCERCSTPVEQKELEQWFFKITAYAEKLLKNLEWIDWSERVKVGQRNWIGKSQGALVKFPLLLAGRSVEVFTTRPDTLFGATFMVLAPENPLAKELTLQEHKKEVEEYVAQAAKKTEAQRIAQGRIKTGVFTGSYCTNPVNGKKIPVWVADYVVMGYGTGAIMAVPAHDQRDLEFAQKYNLPVIEVVSANTDKEAYDGEGCLVNSREYSGLQSREGGRKIVESLKKSGLAELKTTYKLRDWCVSRQRYWGPPIPMVNCPSCGWVAVSENDLPVLLPDVSDWRPKGEGKSPLANIPEFVNTFCPKCGQAARRETDVSDTFLDSAWYFFRYPSLKNENALFDDSLTKKWLPVNMYIGGAEHTVLHLMYSRFLTMVFKDLGLIDFEEPFKKFYAHGLITKDGAKMSKSKGNVVIPDEYIKAYGTDILRTYLMFLGPFNHGGDFTDEGIGGAKRFLNRVYQLAAQKIGSETSQDLIAPLHKLIKKITQDLETFNYNTAIAAIMEFINDWTKKGTLSKEDLGVLAKLLAPFAPHLAEEIWCEVLGNGFSVHRQPWPKYDENLLIEEITTIIIQVNGKVRGEVEMKNEDCKLQIEVEKEARKDSRVAKYLEGQEIKKVIFVPGKLINFVI